MRVAVNRSQCTATSQRTALEAAIVRYKNDKVPYANQQDYDANGEPVKISKSSPYKIVGELRKWKLFLAGCNELTNLNINSGVLVQSGGAPPGDPAP
jgi:hypothetical protein